MRCAWEPFIALLPIWMREFVDKHGKESLQELRLRLNLAPQLKLDSSTLSMNRAITAGDIQFVINAATKYSPWSATTMSRCFYTASGGHRIGLCGRVSTADGHAVYVREPTSLCIRIARDFPGIGESLVDLTGSVLIVGKPGSGKTTLLRDYIRQLSAIEGNSITVVDERQEIFPIFHGMFCFNTGLNTDVISGSGKKEGIEAALRNTGPTTIAVDEITAEEDCESLIHAGWCGVDLIATAHASSREDLFRRSVYRPLVETSLFDTLIIMHPDKSWHVERIHQ